MPRRLAAFLGALALGLVGVAVAATPAAAIEICEQYGTTTIQGGRYVVQNNRWGIDAQQCINVTDRGFQVTRADGSTATNGAPKSYPSVFFGCHYGTCSDTGGLLGPNGLRASDPRFGTISTSVSMSYPSSGTWNAAYDVWFHRSQPSASTGQNDGAELMIWLNRQGSIQPIGSQVGTAQIAGATWDVWYGGGGWNVISYVRQQSTTSLNFRVADFWDDVVSRGYGSRDWYLTSIQAGFEPWISGVGLAVTDFSVTTGGTTPPPTTPPPTTPPPTTPPPGGGACAATYSTLNSWPGGFQGEVTVRNSGTAQLSGWTTAWTFPSGQSIATSWNAAVTTSGSSVTARNIGWNGSLAPGSTATFGFIGSGSPPGNLSVSCS